MDNALLAELTEAERRVWQALLDGDPDADAAALSDDFLGVYPTGFSDKAGHVAQLTAGPTVADYQISDGRIMRLGDDYVLFAYRADYRRPGDADMQVMYISSIWKRRGDGWINVFSQDTPSQQK